MINRVIILFMIKELLKEERPRERLLNQGVESLSKLELIAIILGSGSKEKSVFDLAHDVLNLVEKVHGLENVTIEALLQIKGIKLAKACNIMAAIALSSRFDENGVKKKIDTAKDIYDYLIKDLSNQEQEHFYCVYLNTKSEVIKKICLYVGTINETIIHPREIFKHAARLSAHAIILVHNHPTGDARPSVADINVTRHLKNLSEMMGIQIVDHIIIGKNEYFSLNDNKKYKV